MFATELDELSPEALVVAFRRFEDQHREIAAQRALVVEAMDRRKLYRTDGHTSVHGLVRTITHCPTYESVTLLRVGKFLHRFPDVAKVLAAGEIGVAQTERMARAAAHPRCGDQFDTVVDILVDVAKDLKFSEFDTVVGTWEATADTDGANQSADACHANRNAWIHVSGDGFHGALQGSALAGTELKEILDSFVKIEWDKDWEWTKAQYGADACPGRMPRTDAQRRADAVVAIFTSAVSTPADSRAPEPVVNLLSDPVTFCRVLAIFFGFDPTPEQDAAAEALVPFPDRHCETSTGVPISPNELLAAAIVGWVRRVVIDSRSVPIDMGRTQRLFKGNARIAALMGWLRCFWPGCEVPAARCHTDHLTDWQHGGETCPDNGGPGCPHHNWLKQNRGYTTMRDDNGRIHVYRPNGTEVA